MPQPRFKLNETRRAARDESAPAVRRGELIVVREIFDGDAPSYRIALSTRTATITESRLALLWGEDVDGDPRTG